MSFPQEAKPGSPSVLCAQWSETASQPLRDGRESRHQTYRHEAMNAVVDDIAAEAARSHSGGCEIEP